MAPRASWKGFLRISLVTCPIALYPATSSSERISFNRINKKTGQRVRQQNVDGKSGQKVEADDIVKGLDIQVETSKGEVQLSGFVDSQDQIDRAVTIAKGEEGGLATILTGMGSLAYGELAGERIRLGLLLPALYASVSTVLAGAVCGSQQFVEEVLLPERHPMSSYRI